MSKAIVITDDSVVNSQGFRVMTDGGDLSMYLNNPILLYDHARRKDDHNNVILPIGKMTDIQRNANQYIATPEFDLEDDFAAEIARKYEKGIFNMASIGFEAVEWSEDPALMLPGQMLPTITKWRLKEVSITDIGANPNCHKVYSDGKILTLSANTKKEDIKAFFTATSARNFLTRSKAELAAIFDQLSKGDGLNRLQSSSDPKDRAYLNALWVAKYNKSLDKGVLEPSSYIDSRSKAQLVDEFNTLFRGDGLNRLRDSQKPADKQRLNLLWLANFGKPFPA